MAQSRLTAISTFRVQAILLLRLPIEAEFHHVGQAGLELLTSEMSSGSHLLMDESIWKPVNKSIWEVEFAGTSFLHMEQNRRKVAMNPKAKGDENARDEDEHEALRIEEAIPDGVAGDEIDLERWICIETEQLTSININTEIIRLTEQTLYGWSAMPQSQLIAISASQFKLFSCLSLLIQMGFHHVGQSGLELLTSGDLPALASQSAEISGTIHLRTGSTPDKRASCGHKPAPEQGLIMLPRLVSNSSDPPALASQSVRITSVSHCTWPQGAFI
ncbi:Protein GVQW1, partial [Plecturocebus cupreus]